MDLYDSDSEFDRYTENSDTDDQDGMEFSYGGHAQSILSCLGESIGRIDDYLAFERGFVHGDIVLSVKDQLGQMGRIMDVDMVVELESSNGDIVKEVNSKQLCKIRSFGGGDYVVYGPWLGRVVKAYDLVTVLLDNGIKCEVSTRNQDCLIPVSDGFLEDGPCVYYVGQRVKINHSPPRFKSPRWFCGTSSSCPNEGTVCKVEAGFVVVNWISSVMVASTFVPSTPLPLQDAKSLTLLSCFPHANWQIGDWCKLSKDYFQNFETITKESISPNYPAEMKALRMKDHDCEKIFIVTKKRTKVDVLWQDGNCSFGLDLQMLSPINTIGDHDFWPGQFVLEKAISEDVHVANAQRSGVVKNVHGQERIVQVKWLTPVTCQDAGSNRDPDADNVSAYELIEHPDYSYCLGDVVFRTLPHAESSKGTTLEKDVHKEMCDCSADRLDDCSLQDSRIQNENNGGCDDCAYHYLSCIGNVIGFKDEGIEVRWASGVISKVEPSEIYGIDNFDVTAANSVSNEEATEGSFVKEMSEHGGQPLPNKEEELLELNDSGEDCLKTLFVSSFLLFPHAAIGLLANVASYFGFHGSSSLPQGYANVSTRNCNSYLESPTLETSEGIDEPEQNLGEAILNKEDVPIDVQIPTQINSDTDVPSKVNQVFKKFDIVDDYTDHHFADVNLKGSSPSAVKRSWLRKVQQEWSILEKDLPETIYVRVYEQRIDLVRAAIVGAAGTPYEDALFFFDVCFPPEYPHDPPMVHYISGGLRLNPNLYESGKVCLSLLKTWAGTGTELWSPESSTVLQVLLSLQALVLNEKPYFNEAGYDKQIGRAEGERNSITYNENAFLLSRKSMIYQLQKSPKHFEALVEEHFISRSHQILHICKAYIEDTHVGCDFGCGEVTADGRKTTSAGFKIMLGKLLPKLALAFKDRGISCCQFLDQASSLVLEAGKDST